ncbi:MAG: hypothetical protein QM503_04470 [Bacteroidota bacterium]
MSDNIRFLLGDEFIKNQAEFDKGIEELQTKYSEYLSDKDPDQLNHYYMIYNNPLDGYIVLSFNKDIRKDIKEEVRSLYNSIFGDNK